MYQVELVIVTLSTIMARVALPRATIPENITDSQISIFQVMDDINKLGVPWASSTMNISPNHFIS